MCVMCRFSAHHACVVDGYHVIIILMASSQIGVLYIGRFGEGERSGSSTPPAQGPAGPGQGEDGGDGVVLYVVPGRQDTPPKTLKDTDIYACVRCA